jgi:hypothetical protein
VYVVGLCSMSAVLPLSDEDSFVPIKRLSVYRANPVLVQRGNSKYRIPTLDVDAVRQTIRANFAIITMQAKTKAKQRGYFAFRATMMAGILSYQTPPLRVRQSSFLNLQPSSFFHVY